MALQVWLPLNGDLHNQGLSNLQLTINTVPTYVDNGKIGKALNAGAVTMSAANAASILNNQEFSFACWIYVNADTGDTTKRAMLFGTSGMTAPNNRKFSIFQYPTCNDLHLSWQNDVTNTTFTGGAWAGYFPSYKWTHVAITYKNPNGIIYINGEKKSTFSGVSNSSSFSFDTRLFENCANNGRYLNDYRIYDHALSAKEVEEISKGLILHYKLDNNGLGGKNLFRNTNFYKIATQTTPATTSIPSLTFTEDLQNLVGQTITFSFELYTPGARQNGPNGGSLNGRFGAHLSLNYTPSGGSATQAYPCANNLTTTVSEKGYRVAMTYTVPSNCTINSFSMAVQLYAQPASGNTETWFFGYPKVEYGNKATPYSQAPEDYGNENIIYDSSGYNNNGTIYGNIAISSDTIRYMSSSYINVGLNDYIITNAGVGNPSDAITMNIWFKSNNTSPGSSYHHCFNGLTSWCYIEMAVHSGGYLRSGLYINGTRYVANTNNTNLLNGQWHMLTMTYDGMNIKRYVDAELKSTQAATGAIDRPNDRFVFGRGTSTGYHCKEAYLSDARIYATALTDKQIKELYDTSVSVDKNGNIYAREAIEI